MRSKIAAELLTSSYSCRFYVLTSNHDCTARTTGAFLCRWRFAATLPGVGNIGEVQRPHAHEGRSCFESACMEWHTVNARVCQILGATRNQRLLIFRLLARAGVPFNQVSFTTIITMNHCVERAVTPGFQWSVRFGGTDSLLSCRLMKNLFDRQIYRKRKQLLNSTH